MKTFICTLALLTATSFANTPTTQPSKGCACKEKMAKMEQNIDQLMKDVAAIKKQIGMDKMPGDMNKMDMKPGDMNKMDMKPGDMNKMGMDKMAMKPGEQKPVVMPQPQVNQAAAMPQSQTTKLLSCLSHNKRPHQLKKNNCFIKSMNLVMARSYAPKPSKCLSC